MKYLLILLYLQNFGPGFEKPTEPLVIEFNSAHACESAKNQMLTDIVNEREKIVELLKRQNPNLSADYLVRVASPTKIWCVARG